MVREKGILRNSMDERVVPLAIELHPLGVQAKSCCEPKFNEITFYVKIFFDPSNNHS